MALSDRKKIAIAEIRELPNLVSLSRMALTPVIIYCLRLNSDRGTLAAVILMVVAGLSDFLDGYLARRMNKFTELGLVLDPLADKIFAIGLIIGLIFLRGFPLWLAVLIIARDLAIVIVGLIIVRRRGLIAPSNTFGKYYFASLAGLIFSYVINFGFGQSLFHYLVVILLAATAIDYTIYAIHIFQKGSEAIAAPARPYRWSLIAVAAFVVIIYCYRLLTDLFGVTF